MKKVFSNNWIYALLILTCSFEACHVSKDTVLPDMALPDTFRGASAPSSSGSISTLPWQNFISDTSLKKLISEALTYNNDLQVAIKNIDAARLLLSHANLGNVPTLGFQVNASSSRPSDNSLNGLSLSQFLGSKHIEEYTGFASLSWEADIWGKIRKQKASALASYLGSQQARMAVQTQLISDVSKGYNNLMMLDSKLVIARQNVLLNDSTLTIIQLQFAAGQVTNLAVQQANAQKLTALGLVPLFEQQIEIQENALSILCGKLPRSIERQSSLGGITFSEKMDNGLPAEILSRRPDVKTAELALMRSNADVGYAKSNLYPSLTITAQGGLDAFKASNWFNIPASLFGAVAGGIAQPIFQQKKLKTQYEVAKVRRDQTVIQFRQSVLQAVGEVSDALAKVNKLKQQEKFVADRTAILKEATRNAQMLFGSGLATYLEVITAQSNVLQSELELASIQKDRLDATVELYRSLGGGVD